MDKPNYRKLIVWQKAHENALSIIKLTEQCHAKYSRIVSQCLNASTSIGANLAEGNSAGTSKEKRRYFGIALNSSYSSYEFDNWLQIFKDSDTILAKNGVLSAIENRNIEVIKLLNKLISNLKS